MTPVSFVVYENHLNPTPHHHEASWEDFAGLFLEVSYTPCNPCAGHTCPHKFGMAWSPVTLKDGGTRANDNVLSVNMGVIDLDKITPAELPNVERALAGRRYILHTTHSHREGAPRLRAILALSRPVLASEWAVVYRALVAELDVPADPTCKDLSRLYFLPSVAEGGTFLAESEAGEPVDVDALLAKSPQLQASKQETSETPVLQRKVELQRPAVDDPKPVDLGALRDALIDLRASYRRNKDEPRASLVDNALAGRELVPAGQGHDTALHTVCGMLGAKFPAGTPAVAAVEILRRSIVAMGPGTKGIDHWLDKAGKDYQKAHDRKCEEDARARAANERIKVGLGSVVASRKQKSTAIAATTANAVQLQSNPLDTQPEEDPDAWQDLLMRKDVTKKQLENGIEPTLISNEYNAAIILAYSPPWKGKLRYNETRLEVECDGDVPLDEHEREVNVLPRAVANWLQIQGVNISPAAVQDTLLLVGRARKYNPVQDYLHSLVWDGVPRIDRFLEVYVGATLMTDDGRDLTEHLRRIGSKWLMSAAARGLRPGCKVDTLLILEGPQGAMKSSLLEVLGGKYFATSRSSVTDKDALMVLDRSWIVELGELSALRKSDTDEAKAFFSTREDVFRPPYARSVVAVPRPSVFAATYNPEDGHGPLTDRTGNRRYWVVKVGRIDLPALIRDRDQLFAEARDRAKAGFAEQDAGVPSEAVTPAHRWWLVPGPETEAAEAEANERIAPDMLTEQILAAWDAKPKTGPRARPVEFSSHEVIAWLPASTFSHKGQESRIGRALKELKFLHVRLPPDGTGRRPWVYRSTPELRDRPEKTSGAPGAALALVVSERKGA